MPFIGTSASEDIIDVMVVHVEVRLKPIYDVDLADIRKRVAALLRENFTNWGEFDSWHHDPLLEKHVEKIRVADCEEREEKADPSIDPFDFIIYAYHTASQDDVEELMANEADGAGEESSQDDTMAATVLELPNASLDGSWEMLFYENQMKEKLLRYIYTTLIYSDAKVDTNIISWNRLLLLHGPPGTGKTSLCRALAHKLSIRLADRYSYGKLIEVNSHSLFSKWFSESGKLVQKMFSMIQEMASDPDAFIVVLIDEVESLTASRASASSGTEPSDAIRVVNALLTQLDKLKQRSNVLVVTTSNLSENIDSAFVDRADIKQYIGPPTADAIYQIFISCFLELVRVKLIDIGTTELPCDYYHDAKECAEGSIEKQLAYISEKAVGMSGRSLRRLPIIAHTKLQLLLNGPKLCVKQYFIMSLKVPI
ncbi:AAA-domain-containing protein [Meira miltonrushii]|uniref:AAA-domain-containing protein n=1 Tax=Meira miltonrushii TaxID=1280837 RepID=A0A316V7R9_9BASI|nr:AAA-domain-containing protein [Meira miltonrushii]PWN33502.1 AAA-domain-containing protein [Meira miltonrushii]